MSYEGKQQEATAKSGDEVEVSSLFNSRKTTEASLPELRTSSQH